MYVYLAPVVGCLDSRCFLKICFVFYFKVQVIIFLLLKIIFSIMFQIVIALLHIKEPCL